MPKVTKSLTEIEIKRAKPKEKDFTLTDGKGLQLLIKANGRKVWEFVYTSPTKRKRRKATFKTYPEVSLKQARERANEYRELIFKDIDPIDYFREKKQNEKMQNDCLFEKVVNEWLILREKELKPRSYQRVKSLIINDALPALKDRAIQDIGHKDITKIIIKKNKTAPVSAKRLLQYLNRIWLFAINKDCVKYNIIANIDPKDLIEKRQVKNYPKITDLDILKELINAIYNYNGHPSIKNALRFVLHIPLRASNLVTIQWSYIDFEKRVLTIPREEMKNKDINLPDFTMPLTDEVIKILKEQQTFTGNRKYIFVSDSGEHINPETTNRALQRMGFNYGERKQRTHSFRGTFRSLCDTYGKEHKARFEVMEIALDHRVGNQVALSYKNKADYLSQLRELMEWWSGFVVEMLDKRD